MLTPHMEVWALAMSFARRYNDFDRMAMLQKEETSHRKKIPLRFVCFPILFVSLQIVGCDPFSICRVPPMPTPHMEVWALAMSFARRYNDFDRMAMHPAPSFCETCRTRKPSIAKKSPSFCSFSDFIRIFAG